MTDKFLNVHKQINYYKFDGGIDDIILQFMMSNIMVEWMNSDKNISLANGSIFAIIYCNDSVNTANKIQNSPFLKVEKIRHNSSTWKSAA